jgi:hypothetical protein
VDIASRAGSFEMTSTTHPNAKPRADYHGPLWVVAKTKRVVRGAVPWFLALPLFGAWLRHVDWQVTAAAGTVMWGLVALTTTFVVLYGMFSLGSAIADKQKLPRNDERFALLMRFLPLALLYGIAVVVYGVLIAPWLMRLLIDLLGST